MITGASSGIGKTTAIKLAQNGFRVFAGVRKEEDKITVENENPNITGVFIDVTNQETRCVKVSKRRIPVPVRILILVLLLYAVVTISGLQTKNKKAKPQGRMSDKICTFAGD